MNSDEIIRKLKASKLGYSYEEVDIIIDVFKFIETIKILKQDKFDDIDIYLSDEKPIFQINNTNKQIFCFGIFWEQKRNDINNSKLIKLCWEEFYSIAEYFIKLKTDKKKYNFMGNYKLTFEELFKNL